MRLRLRFGQATALRVKRTTRLRNTRSGPPLGVAQFSCRRRERRAVKSNRNHGPHHFEQNPYPSGLVQPLERPQEIGKRSRQNPNALTFHEPSIQSRQAVVGLLDQRFHNTNRNRDRPTVLGGKETRNPDCAAHRQPAIALKIEDHKKVAWKKRSLYRSQLAGVTDRLPKLRQICPKSLRAEMPVSPPLTLWLRMNKKPPLVPPERPRPDIELQHAQFIKLACRGRP